jgi:uncharacterized membrane protein YhaH (DUF805 family)
VGFSEAIQSGFNNYANFSGRASRPAYWWWFLFTWIVSIVAQIIDGLTRPGGFGYESYANTWVGVISAIVGLALLLPSLGVMIRRLHDTDHSGWWWLIGIIPIIGWIILIFFLASPGTPGENRFGPPPLR